MASDTVKYKGIKVFATLPGGSGGQMLDENFRSLADDVEIKNDLLVVSLIGPTSYSARSIDDLILVDASLGAVTVNLPSADVRVGKTMTIKKIDSSGFSVRVEGNENDRVDGDTNKIIQFQWTALTLSSDTHNWFII